MLTAIQMMIFVISSSTFLPLPGHDDKGCKVLLIRAAHHNPYTDKQDDVFKVIYQCT